ncbi:MAG: efflux RND transporter permease subunit [Clostridia bacterium]|nr:efflux RND transporter permease subunit [Clostridia bacterium]
MRIFTRFSLKNALVIFLLVVMIIGGGLYSTTEIKTELMPNISFGIVTVATVYPGASPDDVAEGISRPIQKALSGIQGLKDINATSNENVSLLIAQFDFSKDIEKAENEVKDAVNKLKLPDKAQKPIISRIGYNSFPVLTYSVSFEGKDEVELTKFINEKVKSSITAIKGVSNVGINGVAEKSVYIKIDENKMKEKGIKLQDVQQALTANDIAFPGGSVTIEGLSMPVKISRKVTSLNDIKAIPIIVIPDAAKMMGDGMGKITDGMGKMSEAIGGVYKAMGEMGKGMSEMGKGMADMGGMIGTNTQAIAMLAEIQRNQAIVLEQQAVIQNPQSDIAKKAEAKSKIDIATQTIKILGENLGKSLQSLKEKAPKQSGSQGAGTRPSLDIPNNTAGTNEQRQNTDTFKPDIVFLSDIALVDLDNPKSKTYTRADNKPTVMISMYKTDDANTVEVADEIEAKIGEIEKSNTGSKIDKIFDTSKPVRDSINGMVREGFLGALFAIFVIALFLRDVRATVIAVVSIPLSILIALIVMGMWDIRLNIMTLSGMAVAVGRIVDDSIVVIENIYRRLKKEGLGDKNIIEAATGEVSSAITSSTITTIAVFLPLAAVSGIVGKVFKPFAITVVVSMAASLLVALTVVPLMSKFMLLRKPIKHKEKESRIEQGYKRVLGFALSHRALIVIAAILLVAISGMLVSAVGIQFLPTEKATMINADFEMPAGTSVEVTNREVTKLEGYLVGREDVEVVTSAVGDESGSGNFMSLLQGENKAKLRVVLKEDADPDKALEEIKVKAKSLETEKSKWTITPQNNFGGQERLEVVVNGDNIEDITEAAKVITSEISGIKDLSNINNNLSEKKPEVLIKVDSEKAARIGLNPTYVGFFVRSALNYEKVTSAQIDGKSMDVMVGIEGTSMDSMERIENFELKGATGTVALKEVAKVVKQDGPVSITERNGNRFATISADIMSNDTAKVSQEVTDKIEGIKSKFKQGVTYSVGGSVEDINESFKQMGLAMAVAVLLVFIIMVFAFGEGTAPLAILFSLPFAAVGAMFALFITNHSLSISGLVGMLMLIGIVVTNAIVLVDRVQNNRVKGMSIRDALIEAGAVRLRPIVMTAAATVMALLPLALGFSEGAIISEELGIVVIGGLVLSTILTLIIVPVAYSLLEGLKLKIINPKKEMVNPGFEQ